MMWRRVKMKCKYKTTVKICHLSILNRKLKRKFQQAILEISEEEDRLNSVIYTNPSSVSSYSASTEHSEQSSQQNFSQSVAQYLHTETESSDVNL
ncbi:unnamed protein product [Acanthoscelides obtectus]|uniref:Uncharacterized protein n=1 Tax=Acanthoscelides obtectus TaxID=200917 RepID=A0A9P0K7Z0_ACAOB|nr:unnamed protein product [Acanthoscelides obtectus]CAK1639486.1 hypothetical protein AOBTE_LOCUS11212 [Acanthoscelides obtectus]